MKIVIALLLLLALGAPAPAQSAADACSSLVPAAIGGPLLAADRNVVELR
jgi:hypothetical protein